jgi:hypothetical protein
VFVAAGNGSYNVFDPVTGALKDTISDGLGGITTGCTFNGGQLVLNEQAQPGPGSITVNALHLQLLGGADIVIAQASCVVDP